MRSKLANRSREGGTPAEDTGAPDSGGGCRAGPAPRLRLRRRRPRGRPRRGRRSWRPRRARGSRRARPRCAPGRFASRPRCAPGPRLSGGQVAADAGPLGARQGRLHEHQLHTHGEVGQGLGGAAIGAVHDASAAVCRADAHGERLHEMGNGTEADANRADLELARRAELLQPKGLSIRSSLPQAPTTRRNVSRAPGGARSPGGPGHRFRASGPRARAAAAARS